MLSAFFHNFASSHHDECGVQYIDAGGESSKRFEAPWKVVIFRFGADTPERFEHMFGGVLIDNLNVVIGEIFFFN